MHPIKTVYTTGMPSNSPRLTTQVTNAYQIFTKKFEFSLHVNLQLKCILRRNLLCFSFYLIFMQLFLHFMIWQVCACLCFQSKGKLYLRQQCLRHYLSTSNNATMCAHIICTDGNNINKNWYHKKKYSLHILGNI